MANQVFRRPRGVGLALGLLAALVVFGGCGTNVPPQELTEDDLVLGLAGSMSDYTRSPESFQGAFVAGAAPAEKDRERYRQLRYEPKSAKISGNEAEMTVSIVDTDGKPLGEVTWKATKQGEEWKLTEAPLP